MAINISSVRDKRRNCDLILSKLKHRSLGRFRQRCQWTTTATSAGTVDGTALDAVMKVGDFIYSLGAGNHVFECTVVPASNAGTYILVST